MKWLIQSMLPALLIIFIFSLAYTKPISKTSTKAAPPKIQVAILLDVSSSMSGLIEQAKAQLWNMAGVLGNAQCNGITPNLEIALYEYGRTSNSVPDGYVKRITPFITDLDSLSGELFKLTTNGGEEYCGQAIYTALSDLQWDGSNNSYKVMFIAGNEDFLQGSLHWTKACAAAKDKGVIVNTIYCGDRQQGIREHWNLGAECGGGSYTHIDQNATIENIPTPYDSVLFVLNTQLNNTYISYGYRGTAAAAKQAQLDEVIVQANSSVAAKRIAVKGNRGLYRNAEWDLVDAYAGDSTVIAKIDMKSLPQNLQSKTRKELLLAVQQKTTERSAIQKHIGALSNSREAYIIKERASRAASSNATLESEIEKILRMQARQYNITIH